MRDIRLTIIAIAVIAVILAGEAYIYTFNTGDTYSITTSASGDGISYSIYSGTSIRYDIVVTDNGDFASASEYYLYYDEARPSNLKDVQQPIGSTKLDQGYYVSQLRYQLSNRGVDTVTVNADELRQRLQNDIAANDCSKGLIVVSGVLPDTVYSGRSTDIVMEWIDAGGRLYWVGNTIGSCYSTHQETVEVDTDYQSLFFGISGCLNINGSEKAYADDETNEYRYKLSLSSNGLLYAPDTSGMADSMTIGYSDGRYSSISMVRHGNGMICIVAGDYSNDQRSDLAQVIGANICYKSQLIDSRSGDVIRGSVDGKLGSSTDNISAYTYLGGYYVVYARCDCYVGLNKI